MNLDEAIDLMKTVKEFEEWDADRYPLEKAEAAATLASTMRGYIEDEAELGGWYTELEEAIGEADTRAYEQDGDLYVGRWRVHLVHEGERYGLNDALTYDVGDAGTYGHGLPLVEFYDMSQDSAKFPEGQFTGGRYYMSTLLGMDDSRDSIGDMEALGLDGGIPEWTVEGDELKEVYRFLCDERDAQEAADLIRDSRGKDTPSAGVTLKDEAEAARKASEKLSDGRAQEVPERDAGTKDLG